MAISPSQTKRDSAISEQKGDLMNRKEFVRRVTSVMRENDIRKPISMPKQVFHISDDEGNQKDFVLQKKDKTAIFTVDDVDAVINTCLYVIGEALKKGDHVSVRGFGEIGLKYRKPRTLRHVETGEEVRAEGRYVPKFTFGNDLRMCAKVYELSLADKEMEEEEPDISGLDGDI